MKRKPKKPLPLTYRFTSFFEIYIEDMETKAMKKQEIISWKDLGTKKQISINTRFEQTLPDMVDHCAQSRAVMDVHC